MIPNLKSEKMHIFYRLSDKGEIKEKLSNVNNRTCLENFLKEFLAEEIVIVADNVIDETYAWLKAKKFKAIHRTSLGNVGSFWFCYKLAIEVPLGDYVYFVENDYIHKTGSRQALLEGLKIADYVTLYDHPDKYIDGVNPKVKNGGEQTKVFLTKSAHWKITNSTTMTFAASSSVLKKDKFVFKFYTIGIIKEGSPFLKRFQKRRLPCDYRIFTILGLFKSRKLISPLPAFSTHGEIEFLSPFINWQEIINAK